MSAKKRTARNDAMPPVRPVKAPKPEPPAPAAPKLIVQPAATLDDAARTDAAKKPRLGAANRAKPPPASPKVTRSVSGEDSESSQRWSFFLAPFTDSKLIIFLAVPGQRGLSLPQLPRLLQKLGKNRYDFVSCYFDVQER